MLDLVYKRGISIFESIDSVEDPDPGSGAFLTLDPGAGIDFFRIPESKPLFWIMTNFWVKSTIILSVLAEKNLYLLKKNYLQFYYICGYKKW